MPDDLVEDLPDLALAPEDQAPSQTGDPKHRSLESHPAITLDAT